MCFDTWATKLSFVFLAIYVPKCQMSSGPHGPIFYGLCADVYYFNSPMHLLCHKTLQYPFCATKQKTLAETSSLILVYLESFCLEFP